MFGYRLIRESDWHTVQLELKDLRVTVVALTANLAAEAGDVKAARVKADYLAVDNNLLRSEVGLLRHKVTGLPQLTAQVVSGPPTRSEAMGAGADLYEDPGDMEAARLRDEGLLHDVEAPLDLSVAGVTTSPE